jgi:hypothetical protein
VRASNSQSVSRFVSLCVRELNHHSAYFDLEAKIKIAKALDEFGVDCACSPRNDLQCCVHTDAYR